MNQGTQSKTAKPESKSSQDNVKDRAASAGAQAKNKAAETAEKVKQQTAEAQAGVQQQVNEATEQVKASGRDYAARKKTMLAEEIGVFRDAVQKATETLREEDHGGVAQYTAAAAEQLDRCRKSIDQRNVGELLDDAQDFTRRHPEVVYGGLFVAGLAAMRFLKASQPRGAGRRSQPATDARYQNDGPESRTPRAAARRSTPAGDPRQTASDGPARTGQRLASRSSSPTPVTTGPSTSIGQPPQQS